ncbi:hypothetical protein T4B_8694 [Trichinella pseudospiralis]|uniref:Uncharacterized protein n=1 Tax=Trichinella pseudospiralis TaxID=6337 RepID=A0A0V1GSZ2_TRIPS|nr:hypothetical protein T4B_8694 [Trichinella pseudospiralis]KRZ35969.1 hypothetical protein T4C_10210 [Trichinella pseudospiralis]
MVNSVCCACNGDSPSFVDDSEEKMEATKRIARLSVAPIDKPLYEEDAGFKEFHFLSTGCC